MLRYYITDRNGISGVEPLLKNIERQILAGVDWIQIREKDLSTSELLALSRRVVQLAGRTRVLINSRLDVALASGAHGIHLPSNSPPPLQFKRLKPGLSVGVSCHDRAELIRAQEEGADYALLGPVFPPLSKSTKSLGIGLKQFAELAAEVCIPVFALGGITTASMADCQRAGAAGVAGISLFQD